MSLSILMALGSGAAWAIGMTIAKPAIRHIDHLSYIFARWSIVAVVSLAVALWRGALVWTTPWGMGMAALAGFLDAGVGGLLFLMAMERTSAYRATTLASTAPLWGVIASILFLGDEVRWFVFVAAGLVVAGSVLLADQGRKRTKGSATGPLLALLAGAFYGIAETVPSKLALEANVTPETLLVLFSFAGVLTVVVSFPLLRKRIPVRIEGRGLVLVSISAVGGAFVGWILWLNALQLAPASVLSPLRGSTIVFAFLYSILFLRERPSGRAAVGVLTVLSGVLLVSLLA